MEPITTAPGVEEGQAAPGRTVGPITRRHLARYAGAGGDFNPMHVDEAFATSAGLPSVFAHGLLSAGILSAHVESWLGRENVRSLKLRFVGQVWVDDELTVGGTVTRIYEENGEKRAECSLQVARQTGEPAVIGTVVATVP